MIAATRIFSEEGYDAATMSGIAAAAGVGIGSLYQYAATKGELAAEVMRRRSEQIMSEFDGAMLSLGGLSPADAIPAALRIVIEAHRRYGRIPHLSFDQIGDDSALSRLREFENRIAVGLRVYLEGHRSGLRVQDLDLVVTMMINMTDAAVHSAMAQHPTSLQDESLATQLTDIWRRYLLLDGVPATTIET